MPREGGDADLEIINLHECSSFVGIVAQRVTIKPAVQGRLGMYCQHKKMVKMVIKKKKTYLITNKRFTTIRKLSQWISHLILLF